MHFKLYYYIIIIIINYFNDIYLYIIIYDAFYKVWKKLLNPRQPIYILNDALL